MSGDILVQYTSSAKKDLRKIEKALSKKIVLFVFKYTKNKPLEKAKALKGIFYGLYRYRVGDYRVIFDYNEEGSLTILTILRIKHRKDIYKK